MYAFRENGQPLEWHFYPFGGHGFVDPGAVGYHAHAADLAWPSVVDFMERELPVGSRALKDRTGSLRIRVRIRKCRGGFQTRP